MPIRILVVVDLPLARKPIDPQQIQTVLKEYGILA
jgi:hypothetical protein